MSSLLPSAAVIDRFLSAALRGDAPEWPWDAGRAVTAAVMARIDLHGVSVLLHENGNPRSWPDAIRAALRERGLAQGMWELRHQHLLGDTLQALRQADIRPVLLKGTALAYSLYRSPIQRTRADTDLLIAEQDRERCDQVLQAAGYRRAVAVSGEHVNYQATYTRELPGQTHALDLHWRISNSELLAGLFTYEELRRTAEPLPRLGPDALGIDRISALLHACFHRSVHQHHPYHVDGIAHHEPNRLVWLKDIDLLVRSLTPDEWRQAGRQARDKGLGAVCLDGLGQARVQLHTPLPADTASVFAPAALEAPRRYLAAGPLEQQWLDFQALGTSQRKLKFLRELFFPPAAYMRASSHSGRGPLAWLYLRRATKGLVKGLTRRHRG
ncbi:MAG: nucleotidyltransferase family protein [Pseudomonadota bacterium]